MTIGLRIAAAVLALIGAVVVVPLGPDLAAAQPVESTEISAPKFLKLSLNSVTPTTVTNTDSAEVSVSGTVTNIGDRVVEDISVRLQRADPIAEPSGLRTTLLLDQADYQVTGPFTDIAKQLSPGQRQDFTVRIALVPQEQAPDLAIDHPGVYPLLLNVNGKPAYGGQARLDDARFLLPVLSLPGAPDIERTPATAPPVATTAIWPLADRPRLVAGIPGSADDTAELTDDELATALSNGGRLGQLLKALENIDSTSALSRAICIGIDPDLLITVQAMTKEYRVLASPSDPDGATRVGTGTQAARDWLAQLRALAARMCTVALPFAQVDLSAVAAVNNPTLSREATKTAADIVDTITGTTSVRGVSAPDSGSIDPPVGQMLRKQGFDTVLLAENAVAPITGGPPSVPDLVSLAGPGPTLRAATFDTWSATALAALGSNPPTPSFTPKQVRYAVTQDSRTARLQDALGAVSWQALHPHPDQPRSTLLMPPHQWDVNYTEATALLTQLDQLITQQLAVPRPLTKLLDTTPDPQPYRLNYLDQAAQDAVPAAFITPVAEQEQRMSELMPALVEVPASEPTPAEFIRPLHHDLLRVLSRSDRRGAAAAQADIAARRRWEQTRAALDMIVESVTVLPPGGVYTLASEESPLLLVARNDLPVAIRIKFHIAAPDETHITNIGEQQLPARGTRSFQIPTEVQDSRNLVIPISLTTPDGVALGQPTSVSVRSNAYGQTLAIMTACAGFLLFGLVGRRLWRRFHGKPDPADKGITPGLQRRAYRYRQARKRIRQPERKRHTEG